MGSDQWWKGCCRFRHIALSAPPTSYPPPTSTTPMQTIVCMGDKKGPGKEGE